MPDAYVIEVSGRIVARDSHSNSFNFFSAAPRFNAIEGQRFSDPLAAERAARMALSHCQIQHVGNLLAHRAHAAAATSRHVCRADALKTRCVLADARWRWTLLCCRWPRELREISGLSPGF
jgi:hypothetical protein